jgi:hypothetical protein
MKGRNCKFSEVSVGIANTVQQGNIKLYSFRKWESLAIMINLILLIVIVGFDFYNKCLFNDTDTLFFSSIISILSGIISAVVVLYVQRINKNQKLYCYYSQIEGEYIRTEIGQDNIAQEYQENLKNQNIGLKIKLKYIGGNTFVFDMELWKDNNARAKGILEFNESNKMIAQGNYKYYQGGNNYKDHFGTLTAYWFKDENKKIFYVLYQHVYPRNPVVTNPDLNHGWQTWEKEVNK